MKFIILIIIFLIIYYLINYNNYYFLSKNETIKFIKLDNDNYIKNMSKYDLYARKVSSYHEYINKIEPNCLDFTSLQKNNIIKCLKIIKNNSEFKFLNRYYKFALIDVFYEDGMPHTRENIIFLSPLVCYNCNDDLIKLMIHEMVHIYQRYNYNKVKLYLRKNNFTISRKRNTELLIRANPDLDEHIYKYYNNELLYIYTSDKPKGLNDVNKLYEEHPFELMAEQISELYK